jgi:hypothetical protein
MHAIFIFVYSLKIKYLAFRFCIILVYIVDYIQDFFNNIFENLKYNFGSFENKGSLELSACIWSFRTWLVLREFVHLGMHPRMF